MSNHRRLGFESKHEPLIDFNAFRGRLIRSFVLSASIIGLSLLAGMFGYRYLEGMPWIDAFVNAAMILSGMGPMGTLQSWGGKLFAGLYALYSGLAVIIATSVLLAPILHRFLHKFHVEEGPGD